MPEAGWYDDPQGGGGKRWWDGDAWSEHTTPPPGSIPATPAAPPAPPGAPAAEGWDPQAGAGGWQAGTAGVPATPGVQPTPPKGGAGKIVALILGLVVVVGVGVVVAMMVTGSDDPEVVATEVVRGDDGTLDVPDRTVDVPEDGTWEMEVDLPAGPIVIDVRGEDDFDPVVALFDSSGTEVARNDDRTSDQQSRFGGGFFDSLIETEVSAGSYRVEVRGFGGHGGRAIVSFPTAGG